MESSFHSPSTSTPGGLPDRLKGLFEVMEAIPIGLAVVEPSGRVVHVNQRILTWLGRDRAEVVGAPADKFTAGTQTGEGAREILDRSLATGAWHGEITCLRHDGSSFPAYVETSILHDEGGRNALIIGVTRDLTEQRALQARLIAEERTGTLGLITRNLAHQIRNHLASVNMNLYFLEEGMPAQGERAGHLEAIRQELHQIKLFLDSLAAFARPLALQIEEVSLNEVVDQALEDIRPVLHVRSVVVKRQFPQHPPMVSVDRHHMARAIALVLQNSAEAMEQPGVAHVVIKRQPAPAGTEWLVEIRDDGCGIPPPILDRVFEPFFSTAPNRLGLGLCMVRDIMRAHGGGVSIESQPGRGTVVVLTIPQKQGGVP